MIRTVACFTTDCYYKEILRNFRNSNTTILFYKDISAFLTESQSEKPSDIYIVDSKLENVNTAIFVEALSLVSQYHASKILIVVDHFSEKIFQKYIKLGFSYILSRDVFPYLIPAILENIDCFLCDNSKSKAIIKYRSLQFCFSSGYIILKECKIFMTPASLSLIQCLAQDCVYHPLSILKQQLEKEFNKSISNSYITVTISRINREVYKATGLRLIKNRYKFGYYLDI